VTRILVDLDHTLSEGVTDFDTIGPPVPLMVDRVKTWLWLGYKVSVFTSRVSAHAQFKRQHDLVHSWCIEHVGVALPITAVKTPDVVEIWDNCAVRVEPNTGRSELHDVHQILDQARAEGSTLCARVEGLVERLCQAEVELEKFKDLLGDKNREISDLQDRLAEHDWVDDH